MVWIKTANACFPTLHELVIYEGRRERGFREAKQCLKVSIGKQESYKANKHEVPHIKTCKIECTRKSALKETRIKSLSVCSYASTIPLSSRRAHTFGARGNAR